MNIQEYLRSIELPQYEDTFSANGIDYDTLLTLDDSDLKSIGIEMFGHRKKILNMLSKNNTVEKPTSSKPVAEQNQISNNQEEVVVLEMPDVFISTHRIEIFQSTYPLHNISSVSTSINNLGVPLVNDFHIWVKKHPTFLTKLEIGTIWILTWAWRESSCRGVLCSEGGRGSDHEHWNRGSRTGSRRVHMGLLKGSRTVF